MNTALIRLEDKNQPGDGTAGRLSKLAGRVESLALLYRTLSADDHPDRQREDTAIALLALLSGGVTLARAVADPALSARIAQIVERTALTVGSSVSIPADQRKV